MSEKLLELSCIDFTDRLESKAPVPGGGGASALVGALGAALCNMVGNLTVGKKKYADVEEEIKELMVRVNGLMHDLEDLVEEDAKAFEPLSRAYGMPKETEEEKAEKARVMEECLRTASAAPLEIMHKICEIISVIEVFEKKGSVLAVSDAGVAAAFCAAALRGAALNVLINTAAMKDRAYAEEINKDVHGMMEKYCAMGDQVYNDVLDILVKKNG